MKEIFATLVLTGMAALAGYLSPSLDMIDFMAIFILSYVVGIRREINSHKPK